MWFPERHFHSEEMTEVLSRRPLEEEIFSALRDDPEIL